MYTLYNILHNLYLNYIIIYSYILPLSNVYMCICCRNMKLADSKMEKLTGKWCLTTRIFVYSIHTYIQIYCICICVYTGKDHIYDLNTLDTNGNPVIAKSDMNIIQHYPPLRHYQVRLIYLICAYCMTWILDAYVYIPWCVYLFYVYDIAYHWLGTLYIYSIQYRVLSRVTASVCSKAQRTPVYKPERVCVLCMFLSYRSCLYFQ